MNTSENKQWVRLRRFWEWEASPCLRRCHISQVLISVLSGKNPLFLFTDGLCQVCCCSGESFVWLSHTGSPRKPANHGSLVCVALDVTPHPISTLLTPTTTATAHSFLTALTGMGSLLLFCFDKLNIVFTIIKYRGQSKLFWQSENIHSTDTERLKWAY